MILVKVPFLNGLGKTKGCEKAPDEIIKKLNEIYTSEKGKEIIFSVEEIKIDSSNIEDSGRIIFNKAKKIFEKSEKNKEKIVFLGGDHSISYSILHAFKEKHRNCGLVVFDAHADCMPPMKEPTHEEWLRALVERGFPTSNIFLVGSRNNYKEENQFLMSRKINLFSINEFVENIEEVSSTLMEQIIRFDAFYLSIDIDVVDPAFAPGASHHEVGGLTSRQLVYLIQKLSLLKNLKAIDIVEVNPEKDLSGMTVKLATKIIVELV